MWSLQECVVSFGEVRRFNLKRIDPASAPQEVARGAAISSAEEGEVLSYGRGVGATLSSAQKRALMSASEPQHSFHVFNGDVVHMFRDCQDKYLHCVMKGEGAHNKGARISIVFKASLLLSSGKRGHGLAVAVAASNSVSISSGESRGHVSAMYVSSY